METIWRQKFPNPIVKKYIYTLHSPRITGLHDNWGWKGCQEACSPISCSYQGQPQNQTLLLGVLCSWVLKTYKDRDIFGQPIPLLDCPHYEKCMYMYTGACQWATLFSRKMHQSEEKCTGLHSDTSQFCTRTPELLFQPFYMFISVCI